MIAVEVEEDDDNCFAFDIADNNSKVISCDFKTKKSSHFIGRLKAINTIRRWHSL
jgi:hypothetical protein